MVSRIVIKLQLLCFCKDRSFTFFIAHTRKGLNFLSESGLQIVTSNYILYFFIPPEFMRWRLGIFIVKRGHFQFLIIAFVDAPEFTTIAIYFSDFFIFSCCWPMQLLTCSCSLVIVYLWNVRHPFILFVYYLLCRWASQTSFMPTLHCVP
jgi:hypothetical protein